MCYVAWTWRKIKFITIASAILLQYDDIANTNFTVSADMVALTQLST